MKCKKILSAVLASAMLVSMSVSAFADASTDLVYSDIKVEGSTEVPTISLDVPTSGLKVIVNPYKMSVDVSADQDGSKTDDTQVISATQYITNLSDVQLGVSATVTGTPSTTDVKLATATTQGGKTPLTTKSVFMYFEAAATSANDGSADGFADKYDATKHILVGTKAVTKKIATLAATDGSTANYLAFHLAGDAAEAPTTAWTETDKVDVTLSFTFIPSATTPAA